MLRQNKEIVQGLSGHLLANPLTNPIAATDQQRLVDWVERVIAELDYEKLDEVASEIKSLQDYARVAAQQGDYAIFDVLTTNGLQPPRTQYLMTKRVQQLAADVKQIVHEIDRKKIATQMGACFSCIGKKDMGNISVKIFELKKRLPHLRKISLNDLDISKEIAALKAQDIENKNERKIERLDTILMLQAVEVLQALIWDDFKKHNDALLVKVLVNHNAAPPSLQHQTAKQGLELFREMKALVEGRSGADRGAFVQKLDAILSGPMAKNHGAFFDALQQDAHDDFIKTGDVSILNVLIKHKMSPLTSVQINALLREPVVVDEQAALTLQAHVRSFNRRHFHSSIFKCASNTASDLSLSRVEDNRVKRVVYELLSVRHPVINHLVYHWTILPNLKNIKRNKAFYGSEQLQGNGLWFQKNALMEGDILNGDGNVICFCPYFVDYNALIKKNGEQKFREDLARLTVDLNKVQTKGSHHQFFKLFDFAAPSFDSTVTIFSDFKVTFHKKASLPSVNVCFYLHEKKYAVTIDKSEAIFYGNLYAINQFCLLKLFDLIAHAQAVDVDNDVAFKDAFATYLDALSDDEIKKLLILFAQHLTIYAEYNFNGSLSLTDDLLAETYHVATGGDTRLLKLNDEDSITFYGAKIFINGYTSVLQHDFSTMPAGIFATGDYVESRGALSAQTVKNALVRGA